jgi:hypothetical protein
MPFTESDSSDSICTDVDCPSQLDGGSEVDVGSVLGLAGHMPIAATDFAMKGHLQQSTR